MWRYQNIADVYGDTPQAPAAMLRGGEIAEEELEDLESAAQLFALLVKEHPDSEEATVAKKKLSELERAAASRPPEAPQQEAAPEPDGSKNAPTEAP